MPTVRPDELDRFYPSFQRSRKRRSSERAKDEAAQCSGKVAFESWGHANEAAHRKAGRLPYRCKHCGSWHVGSQR